MGVGFPLCIKQAGFQRGQALAVGDILPLKVGPLRPARRPLRLTSPVPCPQEYADNLTNSGVHGAVLVLEPTFNAEAMATALGIPSGKHILRRHLAEEMSAIFHPAK